MFAAVYPQRRHGRIYVYDDAFAKTLRWLDRN